MKTLKIIDQVTQLVITAAGIGYVALGKLWLEELIRVYCILGLWQVHSCIIHAFLKQSWLGQKQRKAYAETLIWLFIIGVLSWLFQALILFYLIGLFFVSPVMACWYFFIGHQELKRIRERELVHLK